jgi:hypothetical protein
MGGAGVEEGEREVGAVAPGMLGYEWSCEFGSSKW